MPAGSPGMRMAGRMPRHAICPHQGWGLPSGLLWSTSSLHLKMSIRKVSADIHVSAGGCFVLAWWWLQPFSPSALSTPLSRRNQSRPSG